MEVSTSVHIRVDVGGLHLIIFHIIYLFENTIFVFDGTLQLQLQHYSLSFSSPQSFMYTLSSNSWALSTLIDSALIYAYTYIFLYITCSVLCYLYTCFYGWLKFCNEEPISVLYSWKITSPPLNISQLLVICIRLRWFHPHRNLYNFYWCDPDSAHIWAIR